MFHAIKEFGQSQDCIAHSQNPEIGCQTRDCTSNLAIVQYICAILKLCNQERNPKITQAQSCSNWQPVIFSSCDGIPRLLASCSLGNIRQFGKVNNVIHFSFFHTKYILQLSFMQATRDWTQAQSQGHALILHNLKIAHLCQVVLRTVHYVSRLARNFQILQHNLKIAQILKLCKFLNCTEHIILSENGQHTLFPSTLTGGRACTTLEYTDLHVRACCHNNHLPNYMHVLTFVSASVIQY